MVEIGNYAFNKSIILMVEKSVAYSGMPMIRIFAEGFNERYVYYDTEHERDKDYERIINELL